LTVTDSTRRVSARSAASTFPPASSTKEEVVSTEATIEVREDYAERFLNNLIGEIGANAASYASSVESGGSWSPETTLPKAEDFNSEMELLDDGHQIMLQVLGADALPSRVRLVGSARILAAAASYVLHGFAEELEKESNSDPVNHAKIRTFVQDITYGQQSANVSTRSTANPNARGRLSDAA
jgi:hypothetical protein